MRYVLGFVCVLALGVMGCSEESGTGGSGGDPGTTVVSGQVFVSDETEEPAVGATVSLLGTSLSTTTDDAGEFSLESTVGDVFLRASQESTWGTIRLESVPATGRDDLTLEVYAELAVEEWATARMTELDQTKGVVALEFLGRSAEGGESATLSEPYESAWVEDSEAEAVMSDELLPLGYPWLDFIHVSPTDELTVTPEGAAGVNTCALFVPDTVYPVVSKSFTLVDVLCADLR